MKHSLLVIATLALALAACGKDDKAAGGGKSGGKVASCNAPSIGSCEEYRDGNLALGVEHVQKLCDAAKAVSDSVVFAEAACPTDKLAGRCKKNEGTTLYYEGSLLPIADAEKMCGQSGGTWSAK